MFGKELGEFRIAALGLSAAAASLLALPAHAQPAQYGPGGYDQPAYDQSADVGGVTVYAPQRYATQPTTGARVRMDSVSMVVPLGDLDLGTRRDAHIAKERIERAARSVCQEAEDVYPDDVSPAANCYTAALRQGMVQAQHLAGYPIVAWGYR